MICKKFVSQTISSPKVCILNVKYAYGGNNYFSQN